MYILHCYQLRACVFGRYSPLVFGAATRARTPFIILMCSILMGLFSVPWSASRKTIIEPDTPQCFHSCGYGWHYLNKPDSVHLFTLVRSVCCRLRGHHLSWTKDIQIMGLVSAIRGTPQHTATRIRVHVRTMLCICVLCAAWRDFCQISCSLPRFCLLYRT